MPERVSPVLRKTITRETSCDGKHRYSRTSARRAARRFGERRGDALKAYPCVFCRHWHIGHRMVD